MTRPWLALAAGMSRRVILVGPWAVKLPRLANGSVFFVHGLLANLLEAERWRLSRSPRLARVRWVAPLGVALVMHRYGPLVRRRLSREELATFPFINPDAIDNNGQNVAVNPNGGLVLLDYGDSDLYLMVEGV